MQRTGYSGCGLPTKGFPPDLHLHLCNLPPVFHKAIDCQSDCLIASSSVLLVYANVATAAHVESSEGRNGRVLCGTIFIMSSCVLLPSVSALLFSMVAFTLSVMFGT